MRTKQSAPIDVARLDLTFAAVAMEFSVPELCRAEHSLRKGQICYVRQIAMYLLHTIFELNMTRTAELVSRDRSTVSHACRVVEEGRDDPVLNAKISRLETFLSRACDLQAA